jgi:manganese oxidase
MLRRSFPSAVGALLLGGALVSTYADEPLPAAQLEAGMGYASVSEIPVRTPGDRIERLEYELVEGVKEFRLTAEAVLWEYADGQTIMAWAYNGQVPGPEIRVTEGDRVRIVFENHLPVPTTIHWHGLHVPSDMDGVPGVTQQPIGPGESFAYEFDAKPAGTRFYHTHGATHRDEAMQLDMGLSGAFIVEPRDYTPKYDREFTLILDEWQLEAGGVNAALGDIDGGHGAHGDHDGGVMEHAMNYNLFTINGRAFPDTQPLTVKEGERVRIRLINAGSNGIHPMHLHGHSFKVVAVDGNPVPEPLQLTRDTLPLTPGERYDIEFIADNPGSWVLHCHELHHADMGMIVALHYEGHPVMNGEEAPPAPPAIEPAEHHDMHPGGGHDMHPGH